MNVYTIKVEYGAAFPATYQVIAKTPKIAITKALQQSRRDGFERPEVVRLERLGRAVS